MECVAVDDLVSFEMNHDYLIIEEKSRKSLSYNFSETEGLPTSNQAVTRTILRTQQMV